MSHKDDFNRHSDAPNINFKTHSTELEPTLQRQKADLEKQLSKPENVKEYTIGGSLESVVHQALNNKREQEINAITRQLQSIYKTRSFHQKSKEPERER